MTCNRPLKGTFWEQSKSTRNYDQGNKFDCYRTIPEFQEYVLVDQYQMHVKCFSKTDEGYWLLKEYERVGQSIVLSSIDGELFLEGVYEDVKFN